MAIYRSRAMPRRNPQAAAKARLKHEMSRVVQHPLYDALTGAQKNRFQEAYLRARLSGQDVSAAVGTGMRAATSAQANPNAYQVYYAERKAKGWSPAKIKKGWKAKKARAVASEKKKRDAARIEKNVVAVAMGEIYSLANHLFPRHQDSLGHWHDGGDFIHETAMFDIDHDRKQIAADLYRSRDTKTKKGWSSANVDSPEFIKGLRKIQTKYKPHGLKMTVAVSNPSKRPQFVPSVGQVKNSQEFKNLSESQKETFHLAYREARDEGAPSSLAAAEAMTEVMELEALHAKQRKSRKKRPQFVPSVGQVKNSPQYKALSATQKKLFNSGYRDAQDEGATSQIALAAALHAVSNPSKRQRKKVANRTSWKVFHADHGISPKQMDYIKKFLLKSMPQGFSIKQFTLPRSLGAVPNAMYGPAAGDGPVPESQVHYMDRSGRGWEDRMVDLPPRPVNYGQVIGIREGNAFTLFTVYGGPLAPQNPADPTNQDAAGSKKFWKQHALSSRQWS